MNKTEEMDLYNSMSHQDKLDKSTVCSITGRPNLNIYLNIWEYIEEIDKWVIVHRTDTMFHESSYSPEHINISVGDYNYLYETATGTLYSRVKRN